MLIWWLHEWKNPLSLKIFQYLLIVGGNKKQCEGNWRFTLATPQFGKSMKIMSRFQISFLQLRTWINMESWEFHEVYPSLDVMEIPRYPNKIPSKWEDHVLNFHGDIHEAPHYLYSFMDAICQISKLCMKVFWWRYLHFPCKGMQNFRLINCRKVSYFANFFQVLHER